MLRCCQRLGIESVMDPCSRKGGGQAVVWYFISDPSTLSIMSYLLLYIPYLVTLHSEFRWGFCFLAYSPDHDQDLRPLVGRSTVILIGKHIYIYIYNPSIDAYVIVSGNGRDFSSWRKARTQVKIGHTFGGRQSTRKTVRVAPFYT